MTQKKESDKQKKSTAQKSEQKQRETTPQQQSVGISVDELTQKIQELENKTIRLYADIDNLHKQQAIELAQARKAGKRALAEQVVELFNTFHLALVFAPNSEDTHVQEFVATLRDTMKKAQDQLAQSGCIILLPAIGDIFDPNTMHVLNASDSQSEAKVRQVVSVGYMLDGVVMKPANIMV